MSDVCRVNKSVLLSSAIIVSILVISATNYRSNNISYAITTQETATANNTQASAVNITQILSQQYPFVTVEFQGNSTVVLKGDEDTLLTLKGSLQPFWQAIDKVKGLGYSLDDLTTSGAGSQGNPTRFYAILSKTS